VTAKDSAFRPIRWVLDFEYYIAGDDGSKRRSQRKVTSPQDPSAAKL